MIVTHNNLPEAFMKLFEENAELKRLILLSLGKETISDEKPLSLNEAAEFLGLAPSTIYSKLSRKELPYRKCGGRVYFDKKELQKYIDEGRQLTATEISHVSQKSNRK
jgi:excisionase family DNA binding protein